MIEDCANAWPLGAFPSLFPDDKTCFAIAIQPIRQLNRHQGYRGLHVKYCPSDRGATDLRLPDTMVRDGDH